MAKTKKRDRLDGWENILTAVGSSLRDKRAGAKFSTTYVDELTAEELYRASGMAARVVEVPPKTQLRNGFKLKVSELTASSDQPAVPEVEQLDRQDSADEAGVEEAINNQLDELNAVARFIQARNWERAYGGSAILLGCDDGQADLSQPVRLPTLKAIRYLVVLKPRECWPVSYNTNPLSGGYGEPVTYQVQRESSSVASKGFKVHASRLVRFPGVVVSRRQTSVNRGWGDSIFVRLLDALNDYQSSFATVPVLLQDFAQAVWKIKGLAELIANDESDTVVNRLKAADLGRSILRALVTDAEDTFERQQTPVAGLPDMLDRAAKHFAAEAGIPPSLLFGEAPAGLNATGDTNARWFYDEQTADRELTIRPKLNALVRLLLLSSEGPTGGVEPARWSVNFGEIWVPTATEIAALRKSVADADQVYMTAGAVTPEEVAISRFGGAEWSMETRLDMATRKLMAEVQQQQPDPNQPDPNAPPDPNADPNAPGAPKGGKKPPAPTSGS